MCEKNCGKKWVVASGCQEYTVHLPTRHNFPSLKGGLSGKNHSSNAKFAPSALGHRINLPNHQQILESIMNDSEDLIAGGLYQ